jgi:Uma2 family endonuclease
MSIQVGGRSKLTYEDYARIPDDGRRHEIIDGEHWVNPAPNTRHQFVSRHLQFAIFEQIEKSGRGEVYDAPFDVQLSETDVVQPDLVVVLKGNAHILTETRIQGVPDLVVEILSPSGGPHDRQRKKALYERVGIPEYWIVDPAAPCVEQYILRDAAYVLVDRAEREIRSRSIEGLVVDLTRVWRSAS